MPETANKIEGFDCDITESEEVDAPGGAASLGSRAGLLWWRGALDTRLVRLLLFLDRRPGLVGVEAFHLLECIKR
jgi:hypothetical protein